MTFDIADMYWHTFNLTTFVSNIGCGLLHSISHLSFTLLQLRIIAFTTGIEISFEALLQKSTCQTLLTLVCTIARKKMFVHYCHNKLFIC